MNLSGCSTHTLITHRASLLLLEDPLLKVLMVVNSYGLEISYHNSCDIYYINSLLSLHVGTYDVCLSIYRASHTGSENENNVEYYIQE